MNINVKNIGAKSFLLWNFAMAKKYGQKFKALKEHLQFTLKPIALLQAFKRLCASG